MRLSDREPRERINVGIGNEYDERGRRRMDADGGVR